MILNTQRPAGSRRISLVPLIDVVFILLLFFMLSTSLLAKKQLNMAFASNESLDAFSETRVIMLMSDDGLIAVDEQEFDSKDPRLLRELISRLGDASLSIDTAQKVSTQALITLLDRLRNAGATSVSLLAPESDEV